MGRSGSSKPYARERFGPRRGAHAMSGESHKAPRSHNSDRYHWHRGGYNEQRGRSPEQRDSGRIQQRRDYGHLGRGHEQQGIGNGQDWQRERAYGQRDRQHGQRGRGQGQRGTCYRGRHRPWRGSMGHHSAGFSSRRNITDQIEDAIDNLEKLKTENPSKIVAELNDKRRIMRNIDFSNKSRRFNRMFIKLLDEAFKCLTTPALLLNVLNVLKEHDFIRKSIDQLKASFQDDDRETTSVIDTVCSLVRILMWTAEKNPSAITFLFGSRVLISGFIDDIHETANVRKHLSKPYVNSDKGLFPFRLKDISDEEDVPQAYANNDNTIEITDNNSDCAIDPSIIGFDPRIEKLDGIQCDIDSPATEVITLNHSDEIKEGINHEGNSIDGIDSDTDMSTEDENNIDIEKGAMMVKMKTGENEDTDTSIDTANFSNTNENIETPMTDTKGKGSTCSETISDKIQDLRLLFNNFKECLNDCRTKKDYNGVQVDDPDEFRSLPIIPRLEDVTGEGKPKLRAIKVKGAYKSVSDYLDIHFRLLREDFIYPLKNAVLTYSGQMPSKGRKHFQDIKVYENVRIIAPIFRGSIQHMLEFDVNKLGNIRWGVSKRLKCGSLVCLSKDNFRTCHFATISNSDIKYKRQGTLYVQFEHNIATVNTLMNESFTMVESPAYFEAYRHVLRCLQTMNENDFSLAKYIVNGCTDVQPPLYLQNHHRNEDMQLPPTSDEEMVYLRPRIYPDEMHSLVNGVQTSKTIDDEGISVPAIGDGRIRLPTIIDKNAIPLPITTVDDRLQTPTSTVDDNIQSLTAMDDGNIQSPTIMDDDNIQSLTAMDDGNIQSPTTMDDDNIQSPTTMNNDNIQSPTTMDDDNIQSPTTMNNDNIQSLTAMDDGNIQSPTTMDDDNIQSPTTMDDDNIQSPTTMDDDNIQSPTTMDDDNIQSPTTMGDDNIQSPTTMDDDNIQSPTTMDDDNIQSPTTMGDDNILSPTTMDDENIQSPTTMDDDKIQSLTRVGNDRFNPPTVIDNDSNQSPNCIDDDRIHHPTAIDDGNILSAKAIDDDPMYSSPIDDGVVSLGVLGDIWHNADKLQLDSSQYDAFKAALTNEISLIQGPPGCGKTYVGLLIVKMLLKNKYLWSNIFQKKQLLVVCYTNHALDQFMEGICSFCSFSDNIVRVGSRSKSEALEKYSLSNHRQEYRKLKRYPGHTHNARRGTIANITDIERSLNIYSMQMRLLKRNIVSAYSLSDVMGPFLKQFHWGKSKCMTIDPWLQYLGNDVMTHWLGVHKLAQDISNATYRHTGQFQYLDDLTNASITFEPRETISEIRFGYDDEKETKESCEITRFREQNIAVDLDALSENLSNVPHYKRQCVKLERERVKKFLRMKFHTSTESLPGETANQTTTDIFHERFSQEKRWRLYQTWIEQKCNLIMDKMSELLTHLEEAYKCKQEVTMLEDAYILKNADVIGMTTTGAAKINNTLKEVRPAIMIVEEAAEVFESHLISNLTAGCQQLILIGDHKQLKPKPEVYKLEIDYNLNLSLFERLINNGMKCHTLRVQHRMRPEIADNVRYIYDDLQDHESVKTFEMINGVKYPTFFINHSVPENKNDELKSFVNEHEALYIVHLCKYLLLQGYPADKITILTMYKGQMFCIKREMLKLQQGLENVLVTVVDNYQGEENDIVLLSFVRSNEENRVGFVAKDNRVCVALSRAKKGMFAIGNFEQLSRVSLLWKSVVSGMKRRDFYGTELHLICQNHKKDEGILAKTYEDFARAPEGGCMKPCDTRLNCGHVCIRTCHVTNQDHNYVKCEKPCTKTCTYGHPCQEQCFEKCVCYVEVQITLVCGHSMQFVCSEGPEKSFCNAKCEKALPCGHSCLLPCNEPCKCTALVKKKLHKCGHEVDLPCCTDPEKVHCTLRCEKIMQCGHRCTKVCRDECSPCQQERTILRPDCGHTDTVYCGDDIDGFRCEQKCGLIMECGHACQTECDTEADITSTVDTRHCPKGHISHCDEKCNKILSCGHQCQGTCFQCSKNGWHESCYADCDIYLICGHRLHAQCSFITSCEKRCKRTCQHNKCTKPCKEVCKPCTEPCAWRCKHYTCTKLCGEPCDRPRCDASCEKELDCGHKCCGLCGDPCPLKCVICDKLQRHNDNTSTRFVQLQDCGHVYPVDKMDKLMDMGSRYFNKCPDCYTPIVTTNGNRYEEVVNAHWKNMNDCKSVNADMSKKLHEMCLDPIYRCFSERKRVNDVDNLSIKRSIRNIAFGSKRVDYINNLSIMWCIEAICHNHSIRYQDFQLPTHQLNKYSAQRVEDLKKKIEYYIAIFMEYNSENETNTSNTEEDHFSIDTSGIIQRYGSSTEYTTPRLSLRSPRHNQTNHPQVQVKILMKPCLPYLTVGEGAGLEDNSAAQKQISKTIDDEAEGSQMPPDGSDTYEEGSRRRGNETDVDSPTIAVAETINSLLNSVCQKYDENPDGMDNDFKNIRKEIEVLSNQAAPTPPSPQVTKVQRQNADDDSFQNETNTSNTEEDHSSIDTSGIIQRYGSSTEYTTPRLSLRSPRHNQTNHPQVQVKILMKPCLPYLTVGEGAGLEDNSAAQKQISKTIDDEAEGSQMPPDGSDTYEEGSRRRGNETDVDSPTIAVAETINSLLNSVCQKYDESPDGMDNDFENIRKEVEVLSNQAAPTPSSPRVTKVQRQNADDDSFQADVSTTTSASATTALTEIQIMEQIYADKWYDDMDETSALESGSTSKIYTIHLMALPWGNFRSNESTSIQTRPNVSETPVLSSGSTASVCTTTNSKDETILNYTSENGASTVSKVNRLKRKHDQISPEADIAEDETLHDDIRIARVVSEVFNHEDRSTGGLEQKRRKRQRHSRGHYDKYADGSKSRQYDKQRGGRSPSRHSDKAYEDKRNRDNRDKRHEGRSPSRHSDKAYEDKRNSDYRDKRHEGRSPSRHRDRQHENRRTHQHHDNRDESRSPSRHSDRHHENRRTHQHRDNRDESRSTSRHRDRHHENRRTNQHRDKRHEDGSPIRHRDKRDEDKHTSRHHYKKKDEKRIKGYRDEKHENRHRDKKHKDEHQLLDLSNQYNDRRTSDNEEDYEAELDRYDDNTMEFDLYEENPPGRVRDNTDECIEGNVRTSDDEYKDGHKIDNTDKCEVGRTRDPDDEYGDGSHTDDENIRGRTTNSDERCKNRHAIDHDNLYGKEHTGDDHGEGEDKHIREDENDYRQGRTVTRGVDTECKDDGGRHDDIIRKVRNTKDDKQEYTGGRARDASGEYKDDGTMRDDIKQCKHERTRQYDEERTDLCTRDSDDEHKDGRGTDNDNEYKDGHAEGKACEQGRTRFNVMRQTEYGKPEITNTHSLKRKSNEQNVNLSKIPKLEEIEDGEIVE